MALIKKSTLPTVVTEPFVPASDFASLCSILQQSPSANERHRAARELGAFPEASAVLAARLPLERDPTVREFIISSMIQIRDDVTVRCLLDCLKSKDAALRNEAIEALKQLPTEVGPLLSELLRDPDPDVRIFVVNVLESLRYPLVEQWLIQVINTDPHVNVCATAVDLLGEVGIKDAIPALQHLKLRFPDEPYIQFAADVALKRINQA